MLWIYHKGGVYNAPKFPYECLAVQTRLTANVLSQMEHIADTVYDSKIKVIAEFEDNTVKGPNKYTSVFYVHNDDINVFCQHMRRYGIEWYSDMDPKRFPREFTELYKDLTIWRV